MPEAGGASAEVDLVRNVMPHVRLPLRLPLGVLGDHELKIGVRGALLARDPARLQLDEVRLEEADLVLAIDARRVHVFAHDREVVVYLAAVDSGLGLRDQLCASHVLPVPEGRAVDCELGALPRHRVRRVLVIRRQIDVFVDAGRSVDVVLVWPDLICP